MRGFQGRRGWQRTFIISNRDLVPAEDIRELLLYLTPEQTRYVFARITATTDREAAERAGVSASIVSIWKKDIPEIELAIRLLMLKPLEAAITRLEHAALQAADTLVELLGSMREQTRLQAANSIFRHLGFNTKKYLEVRGQVKLTPDVPDDQLLKSAYKVMEHAGQLVEGELIQNDKG